MLVEILAEDFRDSLAGPHDVGGIDRLVRRYQYEGITTVAVSGKCHDPRAADIILNGFAYLGFQHRYMFVGGRVVDNLGVVALKPLFDRNRVRHIAKLCLDIQMRERLPEFIFDAEQVEFAVFQQNQSCRGQAGHLAG